MESKIIESDKRNVIDNCFYYSRQGWVLTREERITRDLSRLYFKRIFLESRPPFSSDKMRRRFKQISNQLNVNPNEL